MSCKMQCATPLWLLYNSEALALISSPSYTTGGSTSALKDGLLINEAAIFHKTHSEQQIVQI